PENHTVGYGGLPNEDGVVELDAAVMDGRSHRAGAVAGLQGIRHAAQVALLVLRHTDHSLLVGDAAVRFAKAFGFREEDLLTEASRKIWLYWRQTRSERDDWRPPPREQLDPAVIRFFKLDRVASEEAASGETSSADRAAAAEPGLSPIDRPQGTVHCAARTADGDIVCVTSTSGTAFKIAGRVGDSPIVGAGLFVDNEVGSCGCTGRGEAALENAASAVAVELMRAGRSPRDAGREVLQRILRRTSDPQWLDSQGRPRFDLKLYLLAKDGRHAAVSFWGPADYAVTDSEGSRIEPCDFLFDKKTREA
ncbi:MAG: asparaginase, partial [Planctomycetes bacterium]|nr:asparaginase [Planctomycetota bacterium]